MSFMNGPYDFFFTGVLPMNEVLSVLHIKINTMNNEAHMGMRYRFFFSEALFLHKLIKIFIELLLECKKNTRFF